MYLRINKTNLTEDQRTELDRRKELVNQREERTIRRRVWVDDLEVTALLGGEVSEELEAAKADLNRHEERLTQARVHLQEYLLSIASIGSRLGWLVRWALGSR